MRRYRALILYLLSLEYNDVALKEYKVLDPLVLDSFFDSYLRLMWICANYKLCPFSGRCKTPRVNQYITRRIVTKPQAGLKQPRGKELPLLASHNVALPSSLDSFNEDLLFG